MKRTAKTRFIAGVLAATLVVGALPPQAYADVISTNAIAAVGARDSLAQALARAEVRARLESYGVNPSDVQARVDALSDDEAMQLAQRLDSLPAGGNGIIGAIVLVFLVLLLTDIMGLTKVFPFTRSIR